MWRLRAPRCAWPYGVRCTSRPMRRFRRSAGWHIKGLLAHRSKATIRYLVFLGEAMLSASLGLLLKNARRRLSLSRKELASRAGVSARLVAELERGQRPNVSLESALKLLNLAGVSIVARTPAGDGAEIRPAHADDLERAARAAHRRATWKGRRMSLHATSEAPAASHSKAKRFGSVARISRQAYVLAAAGRGRPGASRRMRSR